MLLQLQEAKKAGRDKSPARGGPGAEPAADAFARAPASHKLTPEQQELELLKMLQRQVSPRVGARLIESDSAAALRAETPLPTARPMPGAEPGGRQTALLAKQIATGQIKSVRFQTPARLHRYRHGSNLPVVSAHCKVRGALKMRFQRVRSPQLPPARPKGGDDGEGEETYGIVDYLVAAIAGSDSPEKGSKPWRMC